MADTAFSKFTQSDEEWARLFILEQIEVDEAMHNAWIKKTAREEGVAEGEKAGKLSSAIAAIKQLKITPEDASRIFEVSLEDIKKELCPAAQK